MKYSRTQSLPFVKSLTTSAALALLATPTSLWACSVVKEKSLAEKYGEADRGVLARIQSTRLVVDATKEAEWERESVEATYEVLESFKGTGEEPIAREMVFGPGNCTLGLLAGNVYVLFLNGPKQYVGWPGGSFMTWNVDGTEVKPRLAELRTLRDRADKP